MKIIVFLGIVALLFVASSNARRRSYDDSDDDSDLELSDKRALAFLRAAADDSNYNSDDSDDSDDSTAFDTREFGKGCVKCKFGINPCCSPNFCRKKFLRPDECVEVKTGKK